MFKYKDFTPQIVFNALTIIIQIYKKNGIETDTDKINEIHIIEKECVESNHLCISLLETKWFQYIKSNKFNIHTLLKAIYFYTFRQTDSLSFNNLGFMYFNGYYIPKNEKKGLSLYKISAEMYNVYAMDNLGDIYDSHDDYKDIDEAIIWYTKASDLGHLSSIISLAYIYDNMFTSTNESRFFNKTVECYTFASELGSSKCMNFLGVFYFFNKVYEEAEKWYIKAITEKNNLTSKYNLGYLYYKMEKYEAAIVIFKELLKINNFDEVDKDECIYYMNKCMYITKKLTTFYNNIHEDNCSCCLEPLMNTNKSIIILVCGHIFHATCAQKCKVCPICRQEIDINKETKEKNNILG